MRIDSLNHSKSVVTLNRILEIMTTLEKSKKGHPNLGQPVLLSG
jgi:hypothetical protein